MLEGARHDAPLVQQQRRIVQLAVFHPGRADHHRRAAISRVGSKAFDGGAGVLLQRRLQHQVLRRIAGDEQFGEQDEVGLAHAGPRGAGARQIAGDVAHHGIELGQRDAESGTISHRRCLEHFRREAARSADPSPKMPVAFSTLR